MESDTESTADEEQRDNRSSDGLKLREAIRVAGTGRAARKTP